MFSQASAAGKLFSLYFVLSSILHVADPMQKRFLVVPPTSPTRHQLISGIGIPLMLEHESITLGLTMKAQYFLPETIGGLKPGKFPGLFKPYDSNFLWNMVQSKFPDGRRRREILTDPLSGQKYESYETNVVVAGDVPLRNETVGDDDDEFDDQFEEDILDRNMLAAFYEQQQSVEQDAEESDDIDLSSSRWIAYDVLSATLQSKGFNGRICVLRSICESADVRFSEHLMAELFHIFFTPSATAEPVRTPSDYDFINAEKIGRDKAECDKVYHQCKRSLMEIFTEIYEDETFQFY